MGFEPFRLGTLGGLRLDVYNEFGTTLGSVDTEPDRPELRAVHFSFRGMEADCSPSTARDFAAAFRKVADQADEIAGRR